MLNFNVDPYYDDFDPNNHYHRILFRPGRAVQARELTQSQTILQDQISKFADHIFKQNTPVKGGQVTINTFCKYLKLNTTYNDNEIVASDFLNQVITDLDGIVQAKVIATEEGTTTDSPTLVVSYLSGKEFQASDVIIGLSSQTTAQIVPADHTGFSSTASISEGVFYIVNGYSFSDVQNQDGTYSRYSIGNFVSLQPQTIIVQKYGNTPTKRVGLTISEFVSDYVTDNNLLDPAVGATNYQAPGADRYTITLTLDTKPLTSGSDSSFIELVRLTNGVIQRLVDGSVYAAIDDYFAKRTYDTNGDFVVNDFKVLPKANTVDGNANSTYQLQIGTGVAYVKGYRVENALDFTLEAPRARSKDSVNNSILNVDYGSYLYINNLNGVFDGTKVVPVDFHCVNTNTAIVSTNTTTYAATRVGSGYLRAIQYDSNSSDSNTRTYVYRAYVSDMQNYVISSNAKVGTTITDLKFYDQDGRFSSHANAYYGCTVTIDANTAAGDVRTIVSYDGSTKTATVDQPFSIAPGITSNVSIRFANKDIDVVSVPDSLGSRTLTANADIAFSKGKTGGLVTGDTVVYNQSSPELVFPVGYNYLYRLTDASYTSYKTYRGVTFSSGVSTGTVITPTNVTFFGSDGVLNADYIKNYWTVINETTGEILDLTPGTSTQKIELTNGATQAVLTYGSSNFTATVIVKVAINDATAGSLALKQKNLYTANTTNVNLSGTNVGGVRVDLNQAQVYIPFANIVTAGSKQSLYISDVKKLVKIIDTLNPSQAPTDAMLAGSTYDVTANYIFDNGQTDTYYGHASITLKPGATPAIGQLLVLVDYYSHTGGDGYFTINSYLGTSDGGVSTRPESYAEIGYYTSKAGTVYNLRDCVDFRLSTKNAQATFAFKYSTDPTASNSSGAYLPIDMSSFTTDYQYYLGRKDILILSKDKSFKIIQGKNAVIPASPPVPDGSLLLANVTLDPYTAYLPGENIQALPNLFMERVQHKRWAMSDISDLQTRVNNIEYYTSLSLLEKQASDLQIPDNNGLNRFKNGILVDNFTSYGTADSNNADYNAKINKRQTFMTAVDSVINLPLYSKDMLRSLGRLDPASATALGYKYHTETGGQTTIFTLPYTTANLAVQKLASTTVSLNPFAASSDEGILDINPPMDLFVSQTKRPDILITDPNMTLYQAGDKLNVLGASDWSTIAGTSYSVQDQPRGLVTVSTYASQAQQTISGNYDKVNAVNASFLTDLSQSWSIRAQKLIVRAKGMKVNTPVSMYFDGVNVDDYLIQPNIIELTNPYGTFNEGDVVGYYAAGTFTPTGRVIQAAKLTSGNVRLSISSDNSSTIYSNNNVLQNAIYDENGTYQGYSANGTYNAAGVNNISLTGSISYSAGGTTTALQGGGTLYSGVTTVLLGSKASSVNDIYVGSKINVTTVEQETIKTQVRTGGWWDDWGNYSDTYETRIAVTNKTVKYTATITAYNGTTKAATLGTAINISVGQNSTDPKAAKTDITSTYSINGTTFIIKQVGTQKVPKLSTDEHGSVCAIFDLPSNTFKTGDRILRIDNRTTLLNPDSATTFAQGIFTASSLSVKSQSLNFGASVQAAAKSTVFASQAQKNDVLINEYQFRIDPLAQSFIIDKETYPNGVFIKSIKVFFQAKPTGTSAAPVKLFITDTVNGVPTGMALDHSVVVKTAPEVNVSQTPHYLDPTTYTEFVFPAPVYIRSGNLYAFLLQTITPDYVVWCSSQNGIALNSTVKNLPTDPTPSTITKIGGSPYVGGLFESQNGITWESDQTKNMMFVIDNCVFTAATPSIEFVVPKKLPVRKDVTSDIDFFNDANTVSNLGGTFFGKDMRSDAFNISTTDFTPTGTAISYSYTPTLLSNYSADTTKSVAPGKYGTTMPNNIYLSDGKGPRVLDANSDSSFTLTASFSTTDPYVSPVIADDGLSLYNILYRINDMGLSNNDIFVTSGNTIGVTATYSSAPAVTISAPTGQGGSQAYATANIVLQSAGSYIVDKINITTPGAGYVETPTITIAANTNSYRATAVVAGETSSKGGNGAARYITKKVVLTPANDSADLRVYYTAYKPAGSKILTYYKVINRNDPDNIDNQNWTLMTEVGDKSGTFSTSRDDLREYVAAPGTLGIPSNQIIYTSTDGNTYKNFSQFVIKIVLATNDTTKVPIVHDLRVLALPSGSGY